MFLGETVKNSNDSNRIFKHFGIAGILVILLGVAISYNNYQYHFNDYYHSRQGAMLFMCGFVLFWLYLSKLILDNLPENRLFNLLFRWSKGVTNIYFVQWIVIIWSVAFFGINSSSLSFTILLILIFTAVSHYTNEFIIHRQKMINKSVE
jgi:hypothetical protein